MIMRADQYLVKFNYTESRQKALCLIKNGAVTVNGKVIKKASENINETDVEDVKIIFSDEDKYVSRGALKLVAALEKFNIPITGKICADIGASTGGFTDCLLQRGASLVYAFDSGKGQLHSKIASDKRVVSKEGFNARYITPNDVDSLVDIAVMDVSFISQTLIIPGLVKIIKYDGDFISLIKPQFEAGKEAIGKNGIVKKAESKLFAIERVIKSAEQNELYIKGIIKSPIKGGDGNEEYLVHFTKSNVCTPNETIKIAKQIKEITKAD